MNFTGWAIFQVTSALLIMLGMAWDASDSNKTEEREMRLILGVSYYIGSKCLTFNGVWIVVNLLQVSNNDWTMLFLGEMNQNNSKFLKQNYSVYMMPHIVPQWWVWNMKADRKGTRKTDLSGSLYTLQMTLKWCWLTFRLYLLKPWWAHVQSECAYMNLICILFLENYISL